MVKEREKRTGLEEKRGVGETFSTNNTLSTIVPRTQRTGTARVRRLQHQPRGEVKVVRRLERAPSGSNRPSSPYR